MILEIDSGNSRLKWRLVKQDGSPSLCGGALPWNAGACLTAIAAELESAGIEPQKVRLANVAGLQREGQIVQWSINCWEQKPGVARTTASCGALCNGYAEPKQMGVDRWLAIIAAWKREQPAGGALVVADCGSALTVDLVDSNGRHLGGYIGPGYRLILTALEAGTAKVLVPPSLRGDVQPGRDTEAAAQSGAILMLTGLIERSWDFLNWPSAPLYLTGGDAPRLRPSLSPKFKVVEVGDLVLEGLCHLVP